MSMLSNSIRPASSNVIKLGNPPYSAYKLQGLCARCKSASYQCVNIQHPVFKMVCPECKTYLTVLKQKAKDRNKEIRLAQLANKK